LRSPRYLTSDEGHDGQYLEALALQCLEQVGQLAAGHVLETYMGVDDQYREVQVLEHEIRFIAKPEQRLHPPGASCAAVLSGVIRHGLEQ
jgi:hypothetical protein